jgi:predicted nucleic acid-binding protein
LRIGVELVILFCDTSALMKLLVDEDQSDQMQQVSTTVEAIGVCRISWPETMSALAHLQREDPVCDEDLEQARQHLIQCWKTFTIVEVSQPLVETAGCSWPQPMNSMSTPNRPFSSPTTTVG